MTVLRRAPESPQRSEPLAAGRTGSSTVPEHVERWKWLLGTNHWDKPLLRRLNWLHIPLLFGAPALALYGLWTTQFYWQTWVFAYVYYFLTGIGITGGAYPVPSRGAAWFPAHTHAALCVAGYHRLFAHRAYQACDAVKLAMVLFGTGAFEGSVRWWSRDHRAHHRFVDTEQVSCAHGSLPRLALSPLACTGSLRGAQWLLVRSHWLDACEAGQEQDREVRTLSWHGASCRSIVRSRAGVCVCAGWTSRTWTPIPCCASSTGTTSRWR